MDELLLTAVASALGSAALRGTALAGTLASPVLASPVLASAAPPQLPGFLNSLAPVLTHYGVWAIVLLVFLEDFGIPVPGETVLIAGAVFAGSGELNIVAVGVAGFVAAVAGDNVGYAIGRFGGRALVDRWGKYVFLTPERMDKAEAFFNKHGGKIIAIARFVEGLRQANGIIAGIIEMHWLKFVAFNALGAALWVGTWVSVGYFAGQHITAIYDAITRYSLYAAIAVAVVIVAWIGLHIRKRRRRQAPVTGRTPTEDSPATDAVARTAGKDISAGDASVRPPAQDATPQAAAQDAAVRAPAQDGPVQAPAQDAGGQPQAGGANGQPTADGNAGGAAGEDSQDSSARS
jgi:membrane protein DedA with SNARE-associated domain